MKTLHKLVAAGVVAAAATAPAIAADISGAGSTFAYPIYSKWAEAYKKETGIGLNYQAIGSSDGITQIQRGDFRGFRHAALRRRSRSDNAGCDEFMQGFQRPLLPTGRG